MPKKRNPILSIASEATFSIPIEFPDDFKKAYLFHIKKAFKYINSYLNKCSIENFAPAIKEDVINRIKNFQLALLDVLKEYLSGHPSKAYDLFATALKVYKVDDELQSIQLYRIDTGSNLYRIQRNYEDKVPQKLKNKHGFFGLNTEFDLFHPPFERRRSIGMNRFSISGYPSLYLSESLYTSYSECFPKGDQGRFNAIAFKNIRPLYFIDLTKQNLFKKSLLFEGIASEGMNSSQVHDIVEGLGLYQLIMATHTKVAYKAYFKKEIYYFKAEYIIPQLLLQWVKLEGLAIDGLRYESCTSYKKFPNQKAHFNYVLPVKNNLDKGYCPSLISLFSASKPYNCLIENRSNTKTLLKEISKALSSTTYKALSQIPRV